MGCLSFFFVTLHSIPAVCADAQGRFRPYEERVGVGKGSRDKMKKAFTCVLSLGLQEFSQNSVWLKNKATVDVLGMCYRRIPFARTLYIYIWGRGWGYGACTDISAWAIRVARSANRAMREASEDGTGNREMFPRLLFLCRMER